MAESGTSVQDTEIANRQFGTGGTVGSITLKDTSNKKVDISAHTSITSDYKITLPATIGTADEVLKIASVSGTNAVCEWSYPGVEQHSTSDSPITFKVTVATKTSAHRYHNIEDASLSGYLIDGKHSPYIDMIPGKTYRFDQSDSTNTNHPIKFYTTATKESGTEYTTGVKRFSSDSDNYANYAPPGTGTEAYVEIVVSDSTPALLFYQCQSHGLMGNQIQVKGVGGGGGGSDTNTTYTQSWQDSGDNAILRLTAGGSGSGDNDLTLVAGNNITLTPNNNNTELTIASSGGGTSLPSQTGNADKFLKTDGSSLTWATPSGSSKGYIALRDLNDHILLGYNSVQLTTWNTNNTITSGDNFSYSNGTITVKDVGTYKITYSASVFIDGSNSGEAYVNLQILSGNTLLSLAAEGVSFVEDNGSYDGFGNISNSFIYTTTQSNEEIKCFGLSRNNGNAKVLGGSGFPGAVFMIEDVIGGSGGSALTIQDEGSALSTAATTLNFVGSGVTASGTGAEKTITISGGVGGSVTSLNDVTSAGSGSIITDNERTKLNGIEPSADVTDTANVTAAGAIMKTTIDAKGDILVGTANDTITRLPLGTNNYVLSADSSTATGLKWKAESGGGGGTSLPSQTGNADKFLKTDGSSLTWATPSGSGSGGSPVYAHLQPESRNVDNSISDNEVVYLPIDNSKPPEGVSSYSVGGITLTTDRKGIKLPSNGDYKMDFNINVRKNGNATEFWGTLCQGNTVIQVTSTSIRQVDGTTYSTLVLPAIVKVEDYANEVYKFKVGAGELTNSGEVWGVELPEYPNTVTGSQVTIMKVSDMGGSALTVKDENTALTTAATTLKFVGDGVTASGTGAEKTITISGGGGSSGIKILANETITSGTNEIDLTISNDLESYEFFSLEISNMTATENGYIIFQTFTETGDSIDANNINSKWETSNITDSDSSLITSKTLQNNHLLGFYTKGLQHFESKIYSLNKASTKIFSTFKTIGIHTNSGNETFSQTGNTTSNGTTDVCNKIRIKNLKLDESTFGQITAGTFILYGHAKVAASSITTTDLPTPTTNSIGKTLQVNASGNGYEFSNGASLDGSIILGSQTASASSHIELDAGSTYANYEYFTIIGIDIVCSNNGYIAWKGIKASDNSELSTTTNNKWQVTNLTDSDEEGTFHTQQNFHVLGYHTKGSQNIKVKIFGLHNGGGTQKKYSMFKNIGTHQNGGTETNYQEGTSSQNNTENCKKIRIYNYDLTGSAGTITSGKFILYGHRNVAITNNTILPLPTSTDAGKTMVVNNDGTGYEFVPPNGTTNTISTVSTDSSFRIPIINNASGTTNTLNVPISDQLRVNPSNGNVSIGSNTPSATHKLLVNGNTKLGDTSSHITTITKANITDATITDATVTDATVTNATVTNLTVNGGSTGQILSKSSSGKLEYIDSGGAILQVQSTQYVDQTFVYDTYVSSGVYEYKFGTLLDVSITPRFSNSKIIIHCSMFVEVVHTWETVGLIKRDNTYLRGTLTGSRVTGIAGTMISYQNNYDSTPDAINMLYVDFPNTTNTVTYSPVLHKYNDTSNAAFLNRCEDGNTNGNFEQGTSTIVVYEIRQ